MIKSAIISEDAQYRYLLTRIWDKKLDKVCFVMLNPSTADANDDDPTIRRCIGFAKKWGYGGIEVVNLFAFRATNPKELLKSEKPIGDQNFFHLSTISSECAITVCAWGNEPIIKNLFKKYPVYNPELLLSDNLYCIDRSKNNIPKHPLYLKYTFVPQFYKNNVTK